MDVGINQSNYIEWIKLVQRSYVVAYVCGFIILSHVLTIDSATVKDMQSLPLLGISFPRFPAVLFTLLLFVTSGIFILVAYQKLKHLSSQLPVEIVSALKNFPSIGNSSWKIEAIVVAGIYLTFLVIFLNGVEQKSFIESAWLALIVSGFHLLAFGYKAYNKSFNSTPKSGVN